LQVTTNYGGRKWEHSTESRKRFRE
jgi:hypothetical protein